MRRSLFAGFSILYVFATAPAAGIGQPATTFAVIRPGQNPEEVCPGVRVAAGNSAEYQEFLTRFGGRFKSDAEAQWAWRVYSTVKQSGATVVIGRLSDTKRYVGKPGYCVLSDLNLWTVAINDVFMYGGTDRSAGFLLVSEPPLEIMNGDRIDSRQVENDRETNWRVIYNHELHVLTATGKYHLPANFKPPVQVAATARRSTWSGTYHTNTGAGSGSTFVVSDTGSTLTATERWKNGPRYGTSAWQNCVVTGNTAKCTWTGTYEGDPDKFGHRKGTLTATLSGDTITGSYLEDEPVFDWHVAPYGSAMHKGAVWPFSAVRTGAAG